MESLSRTLVILVALLHLWFMILEMFLWTKPLGLKVFGQSLQKAQASKVLAQNQGLYNGFLALGLIWGLLETDQGIQMFFLICVGIAGTFGAFTVNRKIFFVQALPALIALLITYYDYIS